LLTGCAPWASTDPTRITGREPHMHVKVGVSNNFARPAEAYHGGSSSCATGNDKTTSSIVSTSACMDANIVGRSTVFHNAALRRCLPSIRSAAIRPTVAMLGADRQVGRVKHCRSVSCRGRGRDRRKAFRAATGVLPYLAANWTPTQRRSTNHV
jgi:hypothetical protein